MDPTVSSRTVARRLLPHAAALLVLMALVRLFVGSGVYTTDENAYLTQIEVLSVESSWLAPYPTDEILTQRSFAPLALSTKVEQGWAAYSRHPLYIGALRGGSLVSDAHGPVALSMLGVVLLAVSVGVVCHRMVGADPRTGFWLIGLLSPFFFHGQVVWAHAAAGGLVGVAMWGLFASNGRRLGLVIASVALASAVALRTEASFVVPSLAAAAIFFDGARLERLARAGIIVGSGAFGFLLDRAAEAAVLGSNSIPPSGSVATEGFFGGRIQAATALLLSPGGESAGNLARLLAVVLLVAAVVLARRSPTDNAVVVLAGLAAVVGLIGAFAGGSYVGLAPAAPLFVVGLVAARDNEAMRPLWIAAAILLSGVVLTAPPDGGGLGWGGRYLLLILPVIAPLVVAGLGHLRTETAQRAILVSAAVIALGVNVAGVRMLESNHRNSEVVAAQASDTLLSFVDSRPLLVGLDLRVGRLAPASAQLVPLLSLNDPAELVDVVDLALRDGVDELVLIDLFDSPDIEVPEGWDVITQELRRSVRVTRIGSSQMEERRS